LIFVLRIVLSGEDFDLGFLSSWYWSLGDVLTDGKSGIRKNDLGEKRHGVISEVSSPKGSEL